MKITPLNNNNKENKEIKSSFFSTSINLFRFYISNNYKKISNKIYSIYLGELSKSQNLELSKANPIEDPCSKIKLSKEKLIQNNIDNINNNINNEKELFVFNNSKLKKNIYIFLENELKINNIKKDLRDSKNQILQIKKYNEFKNKIMIFFFSSIIILKYYNIISITSLSIISLMKKIKIGNVYSYLVINNKQINLLLDKLWNISNQTSRNIFLNLSEIIYDNVNKIPLNDKYNKDKYTKLIQNICNEIRNKCNFFSYIIKILRENINNLENQFFDKISIKNNIYEYQLRFFYIFCDAIFSNMFYSTFVQSYEEEINLQTEEIKKDFLGQNEKTFLAIIHDLDSFKSKQFLYNENKTYSKENEDENDINIKKDQILLKYQNNLKSINI